MSFFPKKLKLCIPTLSSPERPSQRILSALPCYVEAKLHFNAHMRWCT